MWQKCGKNKAKLWQKYSKSVEKLWQKNGINHLWFSGSAQLWQSGAGWWLLPCHRSHFTKSPFVCRERNIAKTQKYLRCEGRGLLVATQLTQLKCFTGVTTTNSTNKCQKYKSVELGDQLDYKMNDDDCDASMHIRDDLRFRPLGFIPIRDHERMMMMVMIMMRRWLWWWKDE